MKKLLLVISSLCLFVWFSACKNTKNTQSESSATKPAIGGTVVGGSTQSGNNQTSQAEIIGTGTGIKKDSATVSMSGNAIIHPLPNQDKIDSLKAIKKKIHDE